MGEAYAGVGSTVEDAVKYYTIVRELLGDEWLNARLFRIGTSSLAPRLVKAVTGEDVKFK